MAAPTAAKMELCANARFAMVVMSHSTPMPCHTRQGGCVSCAAGLLARGSDACAAFPEHSSGCRRRLSAYSRGGGRGIAGTNAPRTPFPFHPDAHGAVGTHACVTQLPMVISPSQADSQRADVFRSTVSPGPACNRPRERSEGNGAAQDQPRSCV